MNFAVLATFLCAVLVVVLAGDENMPVPVENDTKTTGHDHKDMNHSVQDHGDMDHSDHSDHSDHTMTPTVANVPSTNSNTSVNDPSAQGSKGGAASFTASISIVMLAAVLPRLL